MYLQLKGKLMNSLVKIIIMTAIGFLMSQLFGCASSSNLVDVWHNTSFQAPALGKVLVIDVRRDATKRRIWEDAFSDELVKHGVIATPSYSLFPDAPPDTAQVLAAVQTNGFDGILVVLRLPTQTKTHYVQGYTTIDQSVGDYSYWHRYGSYYQETEHPGHIDSQKVDIREIDVTATGNGGHLIWSATSKTPDPGSVIDVQEKIVGLVLSDLAKQRIIDTKK
jgi:hypothetical protein